MPSLNLVKGNNLSAGYTSAVSAWHRVSQPHIELKHLVEFIGVPLLVLNRLSDLCL